MVMLQRDPVDFAGDFQRASCAQERVEATSRQQLRADALELKGEHANVEGEVVRDEDAAFDASGNRTCDLIERWRRRDHTGSDAMDTRWSNIATRINKRVELINGTEMVVQDDNRSLDYSISRAQPGGLDI